MWAIFIWALGLVGVNSYLIYVNICHESNSRPTKRRKFLELIATELLRKPVPRDTTPNSKNSGKNPSAAPRLTAATLSQFPRDAKMHRMTDVQGKYRCQWCYFRDKEVKKARLRCETCGVLFCSASCWNQFHDKTVV